MYKHGSNFQVQFLEEKKLKVLESFFAHLHLFIGRTIYNFYACATTSNCHR